MFRSRTAIAAALIALTAAGTTLSTASEADAHPLLAIGLAAGAAVGLLTGAAIAHENRPVIVEHGGDRCVVHQHVGRWGRVHDVEVCR